MRLVCEVGVRLVCVVGVAMRTWCCFPHRSLDVCVHIETFESVFFVMWKSWALPTWAFQLLTRR